MRKHRSKHISKLPAILSALDEGSYFASGYRGLYIFIILDMDLVVVHRVNTDTDDNVTSLGFLHLLGLIIDAKII